MLKGLTITFRHIDHSPELIDHIEAEAIKLKERHFHVSGLQVVIESPNRRHRSGNSLRAKVQVSVRGRQVFASRRTRGDGPEDARAVVTAAFDAIESEVNDLVHRSQKMRWPSRPAEYSFARPREERSWIPY